MLMCFPYENSRAFMGQRAQEQADTVFLEEEESFSELKSKK